MYSVRPPLYIEMKWDTILLLSFRFQSSDRKSRRKSPLVQKGIEVAICSWLMTWDLVCRWDSWIGWERKRWKAKEGFKTVEWKKANRGISGELLSKNQKPPKSIGPTYPALKQTGQIPVLRFTSTIELPKRDSIRKTGWIFALRPVK